MNPYQSEMWAMAHTTAGFSKDPSTKVGAVASKEKRIIASGRNGFPPGFPDDPAIYQERQTKLEITNHAEINLIANATQSIIGSDIFITLGPCNRCAAALAAAKPKAIFTKPFNTKNEWFYRYEISKCIFKKCGIDLYELISDEFVLNTEEPILEEALQNLRGFLDEK